MASITAPFSGCIYIEDLLAQHAGILEWELSGIQGQRIKAAAFAGDKAGCEPTTHHQRPLLIAGGTDALRNPIEDSITIGFDWRKQSSESPCHRVFQIDILNTVEGDFFGGLITYRDQQLPEQCTGTPAVVVVKPPVVVTPPYVEVPSYPTPTPFDAPDAPVPVPEPTTLLLIGGAVALQQLRRWL